MLVELRRKDEAHNFYAAAAQLNPDDARIKKGQARLIAEAGDFVSAIALLSEAVRLQPDALDAACELMLHRQTACDWTGYAALEQGIVEGLRKGAGDASPFLAVSLPTTSRDQYLCARRFADTYGLNASAPFQVRASRAAGTKLRVGYISCDFRAHPISFLTVEMLGLHYRSHFEIFGYSSGVSDGSAARKKVEVSCDRFDDLHLLSDGEAAARIAGDDLDILVDISGYTKLNRLRILSFRPAPVQVSYLAFPGTLGMDAVDYVIADMTGVPPEDAPFYSERIVWLPNAYQANDSKRELAEHTPSRAACGLPDDAFFFCCSNRSFKITPPFFDAWMRLLQAIPKSVIWLFDTNASSTANLRQEAAARGVDPARLIFAPRLPLAEHLARHRRADLFLDTLPYNAHTTMSDTLWAGLPAITCTGETFAGRVGASLLRAVGMPEMVATSLADYEALALRLAGDSALLRQAKQKLADYIGTTPLFDTVRYTRDIERAYQHMMELHRAGRPSENIRV